MTNEEIGILYLHGYGSAFKPDSEKTIALRKLGSVTGIELDYTKGPRESIDNAIRACSGNHNIMLIVGTSMGGWLASHAGSLCGIPFVALNPAVKPRITLAKHIGKPVNYTGTHFIINEATVASYPDMALNGCGLILCERADEVLDAQATINLLSEHYETHLIEGGSHRFESLLEQLPLIRKHIHLSSLTYEL